MTDRPILFRGRLVRAILENRKTQTRRVIKPQPSPHGLAPTAYEDLDGDKGWMVEVGSLTTQNVRRLNMKCPYGEPGDTLWVREAWAKSRFYEGHGNVSEGITYRATDPEGEGRLTPWKPSIHLKRADSRIDLGVVRVRAERLASITEDDAKAEGVSWVPKTGWQGASPDQFYGSARAAFRDLWNSINAEPKPTLREDGEVAYYTSYPFDGEQRIEILNGVEHHIYANPFVWVIDFEVRRSPSHSPPKASSPPAMSRPLA